MAVLMMHDENMEMDYRMRHTTQQLSSMLFERKLGGQNSLHYKVDAPFNSYIINMTE